LYFAQARWYDGGVGRFVSEDTYWNTQNMIYGDYNGNKSIPDVAAIMQSGNLYGYCTGNPVKYVDYSGKKRTDTNYTYNEFVYRYDSEGNYINIEHVKHSMIKSVFSNLDITLYTMPGKVVGFNRCPDALFNGETEKIEDINNLFGRSRNNLSLYGYAVFSSINSVEIFDKKVGERNAWNAANFGITVVNNALNAVPVVGAITTGASATMTVTDTTVKLINGEIGFIRGAWNLTGIIPGWGLITTAVNATIEMNEDNSINFS